MSNIPRAVEDKLIHDDHEIGGEELICHTRKLPHVLYGIFVELLRDIYSTSDGRMLGTTSRLWNADPQKTRVWIDTECRWEDERPEFRPAIYIGLSTMDYKSLTGQESGLAGGSLIDGEEFYAKHVSGNVSFTHIAATSGEAVDLCDTTLDYIDAFSSVIRRDFCFETFSLIRREPLKQLPKEAKERYGSVATFAYTFQDCWTLKLESPKLKIVSLTLDNQLGTVL